MQPPSQIDLPRDHYAHPGAPAEWWWHTGTLHCQKRQFGFEICAAGFLPASGNAAFLMCSTMVTDVALARHYQKLDATAYVDGWAESDPHAPWHVVIGQPGDPAGASFIAFRSDIGKPLAMQVQTSFIDQASGCPVSLDLRFSQQRPPLLVWGSGRSPEPSRTGKSPLQEYNYYYSLTDLETIGSVKIGDEIFTVNGLTWMDHQFGAWAQSIEWRLQNMQLDNGFRISNFTHSQHTVHNGEPRNSHATILSPDGRSTFVSTTWISGLRTFTGASGSIYFLDVRVEIPSLKAVLTVESLVPNQEFSNPTLPGTEVYEGIASVTGSFDGKTVCGTAWNEQRVTSSNFSI